MDLARVHLQKARERVADAEGPLRRVVNVQLFAAPFGERGRRLHHVVVAGWRNVVLVDDLRRAGDRGVRVAARGVEFGEGIAVALRPRHDGLAGLEGRRRFGLQLQRDEARGVLRLLERLGEHDGERLALVTDALIAHRQEGLRRRRHRGPAERRHIGGA